MATAAAIRVSGRKRVGERAAARVALPSRDPYPITDVEFDLFRNLIQREAGIHLSAEKKSLLTCRLRARLRQLQLRSFSAYYRLVKTDLDERIVMLDRITTNETQFFREPQQFGFLEDRVFPRWRREGVRGKRRIRVWSTACSTGEEPFSIAMHLLYHFPEADIRIIATDLSTNVLEVARGATWPYDRVAEIPTRYLKAFMLRGTRSQEGMVRAAPEIRSLVRFHRLNLNADTYPITGRFDLVFCRNVLIYFDQAAKSRVLRRLLGHLRDDGLLLVGHAESLIGLVDGLQPVAPTIYRRRPGSVPAPASAGTRRR